jgi:hypothetical protein
MILERLGIDTVDYSFCGFLIMPVLEAYQNFFLLLFLSYAGFVPVSDLLAIIFFDW